MRHRPKYAPDDASKPVLHKEGLELEPVCDGFTNSDSSSDEDVDPFGETG